MQSREPGNGTQSNDATVVNGKTKDKHDVETRGNLVWITSLDHQPSGANLISEAAAGGGLQVAFAATATVASPEQAPGKVAPAAKAPDLQR